MAEIGSRNMDEHSAVMAGMDQSALEAEQEFKAMSQHLTVPVARWWQKHYAKAGHKRLGRMMVQFAKSMEKTGPNQWAEADKE